MQRANLPCISSNRRKNKNAHELAEIISAALIGAGVALFIYFHGRRPILEVRRSAKEDSFKERIEIQNHSQNAYSYRIRVGSKYLTWQKNGATRTTLQPGGASGVVLDEVTAYLGTEEIVIECAGWLPWYDRARVFRRRLEEIG